MKLNEKLDMGDLFPADIFPWRKSEHTHVSITDGKLQYSLIDRTRSAKAQPSRW